MAMLKKSNSFAMGSPPSFFDLKKQASFFIKEKIKTVRLAFTDVTPAQLMTEEATDENSWAPNAQILGSISKSAFDLDDFWRIVDVLHKRFVRFERKKWRASYNSVLVLEHLLTHGPESVAEEFQSDRDVIAQMEGFQYIDEKGFNWGLAVRKKSEKVLKLLQKGPMLKEERSRARELSRGIQGFGSFNHKSSFSEKSVLEDSSFYRKCNSKFNEQEDHENRMVSLEDGSLTDMKLDGSEAGLKENVVPGEMKPLLGRLTDEKRKDGCIEEDGNHPFGNVEKPSVVLLLNETEGSL